MLIEAPITWTTRLALLALRRLSYHPGLIGHKEFDSLRQTSEVLTGGNDREAWTGLARLGRKQWTVLANAIRQAIDRLWLTLEVFLSWKTLEPKLDSKGQRVLQAMGECSFFRHLHSIGSGADCRQVVREIRTLSNVCNFSASDVEVDALRREFFSSSSRDFEANLEEEWNTLWELANDIDRNDFSSAKSLFQVHTDQGDSLLVGLLNLFTCHDLKIRERVAVRHRARILDEVISWLTQQQELLQGLLDERSSESAWPMSSASATAETQKTSEVSETSEVSRRFSQDTENGSRTAGLPTILHAAPPTARGHIARGDAYRLNGEYELAILEYTQALQLEGENASALLKRGQAFYVQEQFGRAIDDFSVALRVNPRWDLAYLSRGKAFVKEGNLTAAITDFSEALQIDPGNPWAYHYRGESWAAQNESERAILDFSNVLRLNPEATLSYMCRAAVHVQKKQYDQAIADYSNALRLDPLNVRVLQERGVAYREAGRFDQAETDFEHACELDPANADLLRERGVLRRLRGHHEEAVADFTAALELGGDHADCYYQRGLAYKALGVWKRALDDLNRTLQLNDKLAEAYDNRAEILAAQGRDDLALTDLKSAIATNPRFALAYVHHARILLKAGRAKEALVECDQALELDPQLSFAHLTRGTIASHLGNYEAALASFTEAIRLEPSNARAYYHRGLARAKSNYLHEALNDLTESLRLDPQGRTYCDRAVVLDMLGKHEKAVSDLASAVRLDARFAAAYCNQRGRIHRKQQQYEWAAADYRLALLFDKDNVPARTGLERVLKALKSIPPRLKEEKESLKGPQVSEISSVSEVPMKTPTVAREPGLPSRPRQDSGPKPPHSIPSDLRALTQPGAPEAKIGPDEMVIDFSTAVSDISVPSEVRTKSASVSSPSPRGVREGEAPAEPVRSEARREPRLPEPAKPVAKNTPRAPRAANLADATEPELDSGQFLRALTQPGSPSPDSGSDTEEYDMEQSQIRAKEKAEESELIAELRAEAEMKKKRDAAWAAARRAKPAEADDEDSDLPFIERWKKPLIGVAAALVLGLIGYYGRDYWRTHRKVDPPLDAEVVWQDYCNDPVAANKKYANHQFSIIGRIVIEPTGGGRPARIYFQAPDEKRLRIQCTFTDWGEFADTSNRSSNYHLISGEFKLYEAGPVIELSNCTYVGGAGPPVSATAFLGEPICRLYPALTLTPTLALALALPGLASPSSSSSTNQERENLAKWQSSPPTHFATMVYVDYYFANAPCQLAKYSAGCRVSTRPTGTAGLRALNASRLPAGSILESQS